MTKPEKKLQAAQLVSPRSFCWNEKCADHGRVGAGNLRKFGFTRKGRQRWQCTTCEGTFSETHGTVFHGKKHDEQTILECLAMLADRNSLAAIHRIKGIKEETVTAWLEQAARHSETLEAVLLGDHQLSRAQLDALWTFVGHKGEKGGAQKSRNAAPSGAGRPSRPRLDCASGARSPKQKKKSHKH
jgi:transposase-like protein